MVVFEERCKLMPVFYKSYSLEGIHGILGRKMLFISCWNPSIGAIISENAVGDKTISQAFELAGNLYGSQLRK